MNLRRSFPSLFLSLASCLAPLAHGQTEHVLFDTPVYENPASPVVRDAQGNLYGITLGDLHNRGTVYKLTPGAANGRWTSQTLHIFTDGPNAKTPDGNLVLDGPGNIFGTASTSGGSGYLYEITIAGEVTILHAFSGSSADVTPSSLLLVASNTYYGTAGGGTADHGVLLKLTNGVEQILYNFQGPSDGEYPNGPLALDSQGNLYGTTYFAGPNHAGTIFKLAPDGTFTTLYAFGHNPTDALYPRAGLIVDAAGNLYGTSLYGGDHNFGTVFEFTTANTFTILYSFKGGHNDGQYPEASLILDNQGNLYGTTTDDPNADGPFGTVFELTPEGREIILHSFTGAPDGFNPAAPVIMDERGHLYGTTTGGYVAYAGGTVYEVAP